MSRQRTESHERRKRIAYLCIVIRKASQNHFPSWRKTFLQLEKNKNIKTLKTMNEKMKTFIRYLVVAVCSAIVTYLTSSCTAGLVIGKNQRQQQENNISTRTDSTQFVPTITIR